MQAIGAFKADPRQDAPGLTDAPLPAIQARGAGRRGARISMAKEDSAICVLETLFGTQQVSMPARKELAIHRNRIIGNSKCGSDHPNPANSISHPAITPSTDLLPSQPAPTFGQERSNYRLEQTSIIKIDIQALHRCPRSPRQPTCGSQRATYPA